MFDGDSSVYLVNTGGITGTFHIGNYDQIYDYIQCQ